MIEEMTVRNFSPATQESLIHAVSKFGAYFGRSPDQLGLESRTPDKPREPNVLHAACRSARAAAGID